jgi:hypothetical protein
MSRRSVALLALATLVGPACAGDVAGMWRAQRMVDGTSVEYELALSQRGGSLRGSWSVEGSRPSLGCVRGSGHGRAFVAATCRLDGSVGARDANDICPKYGGSDNRFVRRGKALIWQTRSTAPSAWSTFVVLHRVAGTSSADTLGECNGEKS